MKVEFVKAHNEYAKGDVVEIYDDQANYLIRVGAAKEWVKKKEDKAGRKTKEDKGNTETK